MNDDQKRAQSIVIGAAVLIIILVLGVSLFLVIHNSNNTKRWRQQANTEPERAGTVTLNQQNDLLEHGITTDQLTSLKNAFGQYSKQSGQKVYAVDTPNITHILQDPAVNGLPTLNSPASLNGKSGYSVKIVEVDLNTVYLYLYSNGALTFKSLPGGD